MGEISPDLIPLVNFVSVVVAGSLIGWTYYKSHRRDGGEPKPPPEVQIVGGALADRTAMIELARSVEGLTAAVERNCDLLERRAHDELVEAEVKRRLSAMGKG